jgi:hypothetical protein
MAAWQNAPEPVVEKTLKDTDGETEARMNIVIHVIAAVGIHHVNVV